jgi:phospholipid/cholesterol/gamma-HCH transport system substrate-binding protein
MRNSLETRLGLFVALTLIASVLIADMVGGLDVFKGGYHVSALFKNVQNLKLGDPVKMAGVNVGRVDKIELADAKVRVGMRLNKGTIVKTDSTATILFTGLMGQNYVAIDFGSPGAPAADPSSDIVLTTAEQPDLNALMAKMDNAASGVENLTKSFTGDKIDNLLGPITDFLKQNSGPLSLSISNMQAISSQIASGQGTVGRLIYSNELYDAAFSTVTNMQDAATQIKSTIGSAQTILADINAGNGTIGKLVKDEALYNQTASAMTNLNQILFKINNGDGTIGKLINDQEFYKNAKLTLQKVDKATEGLEDQGPLSVLGTAAGNLF